MLIVLRYCLFAMWWQLWDSDFYES